MTLKLLLIKITLKELENKDFEIFEVSISTQGLTEEFQ